MVEPVDLGNAAKAAFDAATKRLVDAGKHATPEMAKEAAEALTHWLNISKTESANRWTDLAAKVSIGSGPSPTTIPAAAKGMKVSTAVLGTIAIGGGIYLASKLLSKPKERPSTWTGRIASERSPASQQPVR